MPSTMRALRAGACLLAIAAAPLAMLAVGAATLVHARAVRCEARLCAPCAAGRGCCQVAGCTAVVTDRAAYNSSVSVHVDSWRACDLGCAGFKAYATNTGIAFAVVGGLLASVCSCVVVCRSAAWCDGAGAAAAVAAAPAVEKPAADAALRPAPRGFDGSAQCAICLDDLSGPGPGPGRGAVAGLAACRHLFHAACIAEWLRRRRACPSCMAEV